MNVARNQTTSADDGDIMSCRHDCCHYSRRPAVATISVWRFASPSTGQSVVLLSAPWCYYGAACQLADSDQKRTSSTSRSLIEYKRFH